MRTKEEVARMSTGPKAPPTKRAKNEEGEESVADQEEAEETVEEIMVSLFIFNLVGRGAGCYCG